MTVWWIELPFLTITQLRSDNSMQFSLSVAFRVEGLSTTAAGIHLDPWSQDHVFDSRHLNACCLQLRVGCCTS